MRKAAVYLCVIALLALTCNTLYAASKKEKSGSTKAKITIKVLGSDQYALTAEKELIREFEEASGIKVELTAPAWQAWYDKQVLEISGGSSVFDVYEWDALTSGVFLAGDGLKPFTQYLADPKMPDLAVNDFVPGLVKYFGTKADGSIVGVPFYHSNRVYAYRKDLFENAKEQSKFKSKYGYQLLPPVTWDQFKDVCEFFTRDTNDDGTIDFWGTTAAYTFGISWDNFADRIESYVPFKDNEWWFDKSWNALFNNAKAVKALEEMVEIYNNEWVAPGALKKSWGDVNDEFRAGNVALTDMFTEALTVLEFPDQSKVAGKVGYYIVPKYQQNHTRLSSWMVGINSKSKRPAEAYRYIAWLTSKEIDKRLVTDTKTAKRMPCRMASHYDPEVLKLMPVLSASAQSFGFAVPWPLYPEFVELYENLSNEIQNAITGTKAPNQALADAEAKMKEVMKKAGKLK